MVLTAVAGRLRGLSAGLHAAAAVAGVGLRIGGVRRQEVVKNAVAAGVFG